MVRLTNMELSNFYVLLFSKKFKPVLQFDLHENFLIEYASLKEASEKTGISHIGDVCNGKRKSAGGFLWRWKND